MASTVVRERVAGMHCSSCEHLIESELSDIRGYGSPRANARRGTIEYIPTGTPDRRTAARVLAAHGYRLGARPSWLAHERRVWRDVVIGALIVGVLALASRFGAFDAAANLTEDLGTSTLLLPLLVGIAAGFSTCLATVGGLVLAVSANSAADSRGTSAGPLRGQLAFHAGRITSFVVLGAAMGYVGQIFTLTPTGLSIALILAALVMVALGLQLTGISPRLAGLVPAPPRWAQPRVAGERVDSPARAYGGAALLGAGSFFLPCGFTQAMQVFALSTGSALHASLILGTFALGTTPALFALGSAPLLAKGTARDTLLRIAGVGVLAFAGINLAAGTAGLGFGHSSDSGDLPPELTANVRIVDGVQIATMTVEGDAYVPADTVVYAGMPVRFIASGESISCASFLVGPELNIPPDAAVLPGQPLVFEFTLDSPGRVDFSCAMRMYWGSVTAIPAPSNSAGGE